jgi:hypothetical protein
MRDSDINKLLESRMSEEFEAVDSFFEEYDDFGLIEEKPKKKKKKIKVFDARLALNFIGEAIDRLENFNV